MMLRRGERQVPMACRKEEEQVGSNGGVAALAALSVAISVWTSDGIVDLGKQAQARAEESFTTATTEMTIQEKREQMRLKRLAQVEEEKKRVEEQRIQAEETKKIKQEEEAKRIKEEEEANRIKQEQEEAKKIKQEQEEAKRIKEEEEQAVPQV